MRLVTHSRKILWLRWMWIVHPTHVITLLILATLLALRLEVKVFYFSTPLHLLGLRLKMSAVDIPKIHTLVVYSAQRLARRLQPILLVALPLRTSSILRVLPLVLLNRAPDLRPTDLPGHTPLCPMMPSVPVNVKYMIDVLPTHVSGSRSA